MKTSSNKRFSRKHDRKVLVAEESTKSWADSDSDSSSSSSSSSDSEQEEVHCFMVDQTDDDETELSKLQAKNEMLKDETSELKAEIEALNQLVSSWNHSSRVLHKLNEYQKLASDKTGVGFNNSEFSEGETSTQSRPAYDKFNKMSFVKADMIYNCPESVKYDNQNSPKLSENGKSGIGFSKPESFKPNWLKNILDKDKAKAGQKPFAGSFNAITVEKFSLLTAVVCDVKMNWGSVLFGILKNMVTPGTKQAKGFAIQSVSYWKVFIIWKLGESSEFPSSKILTDKTIHRYIAVIDKSCAQEPADALKVKKAPRTKVASKKRPADIPLDVPVLKKKRTSKKKSPLEIVVVAQEAIPILSVPVSPAVEPMVEDQQAEFSNEQPADKLPTDKSAASTEERHWFDLSYEELIAKWASERPITSPADTNDEIEDDKPAVDDPDTIINQVLQHLDSTSADKNVEPDEEVATMDVDTAGEDQQGQEPVAQNTNNDLLDDDEQKSLDDILLMIPVDVPLPSAGMEITKIVMGNEIKIPGVTERTWFLSSLPKILADHKGKAILVEKDPIKGNPAQEHYFLICADIDLLVALRAKVVDEVALFFNSFSLKKLATINIEEMYKKEELVLSWGETESPQLAIQRKFYILLKYREVLVWKFLESWRSNFVPGQGSSAVDRRVIELLSDLHVSVLEELTKAARAHGITWKKACCSTMFEESPCADQWVQIPRQISSYEVHRQRQYDDTLPSVSEFFRLMRKIWADVCLEVAEFCAFRRLLPVGSINSCRALEIVETDSRVDYHQPTVFALRLSQFCTVHIQYSLFSRLTTTDISDFLSSIALDRTALRSVQRSFAQSVVPSVQFSLDQRPSSPTSADNSSSLHFDASDIDAAVSSLPPVSPDISAALADFQAILSEQVNESQSGISSRLHKIEQVLRDNLCDQAALFKYLFQEARQEGRTIANVQTLRFNEFRKHTLAQNASIFTGLADVRKEVQEVNAKVDILASRVNAVQKDVEATKEAISHQLFEFQSQAQENQNILHAQLSEFVDYIRRGGADKKGESGSRGLQQPSNVQIEDSAVRTPTFAQRVEIAQRHIVQTVLDADSNRESLERQAEAERDRERIRREARMFKRRRKY
ncbi:NBS-LRR type disease resistance protein [Dorcoceras hygrometricum]|uniref:NBS-LRR type disease resistance protein n=1 Tax=Dorcoceras hygrometricum TaxID=472368 RepID=A0A2Z7ADH8_9LAMI|nr:NBS-LRR type disease resistance protein [Dorcoceras hygrometricum]